MELRLLGLTLVSVTLAFPLLFEPVSLSAEEPSCRGTKKMYKGTCHYPDRIKELRRADESARARARDKAKRAKAIAEAERREAKERAAESSSAAQEIRKIEGTWVITPTSSWGSPFKIRLLRDGVGEYVGDSGSDVVWTHVGKQLRFSINGFSMWKGSLHGERLRGSMKNGSGEVGSWKGRKLD